MSQPHAERRRRPGTALAFGVSVVGAVGAVGLTTYAGGRVGSPMVLRLLFAAWVVAPFAAMVTALVFARPRQPSMRAGLNIIALVTAVGSLVAYAYYALGTARPPTAAFVLIPPASWLLFIVALGAMAFSTTRHSR
jgi:ACR3 family arsenite efflux pump ArsB